MRRTKLKALRYRGDVYERVPTQVRFKGAIYVQAADPLKQDAPKIDLPQWDDKAQEHKQKIVEELGEDQAEKQQERPGEEFESQQAPVEPLKEELVQKHLDPLISSLKAEIDKYFAAADIKRSGEIVPVALEYDGLDMLAPLNAGNFSGLPRTDVQFDFAVNLPTPKGEQEKESFVDRLVQNVRQVIKGSQQLQELIFRFCNYAFVATGGADAEELLLTIAFLQNEVEARPGELASVPAEEADEEDKLDWLKLFIRRLNEGEYMRFIRQRVHKSVWDNPNTFLQLAEALQEQRIITSQQLDTIKELVSNLDQSAYKDLVQEALNPAAGSADNPAVLKDTVKKAVHDLTRHEGYTGDVHIGIDEEEGKIIASIDSPYPMVYIYEQKAGGKVELVEAATDICNYSWSVKTADDAEELLTVTLDLAEAAGRSIDEGLSQKSEKVSSKQELYRKLMKLEEEESQKKKEEEEAPPKERPVSDEELMPSRSE